MQSGDSQEIINRLVNAEVELAIVGSCPENRKLEYTALASDVLVLIVSPQHPWSERGMISLEDLPTEPLVARESGSGSERALLQELQRINFNPEKLEIAARLGSNEAVRLVVSGGYGCAFVSELSVQRELASGELRQVSVGGMQVERKFWLARIRGRTPSPAALAVSELLFETYSPGSSF